ncbi:hypothetical protein [Paenibacillus medicaginis]|uniref:Uncharacterized protein n=1 Tax=Paenibacillus medicaginis TaxID=1470560 RepID=A0ABV5C3E5_9BACL
MGQDKEENDMISPNKKIQETTTASNETVMKLAKECMEKYRKTLDKLAKN